MNERERQTRLAAALEQLPVLMIVTEGADHRLVSLSAGARRLLGDASLHTPLSDWTEVLGRQLVERHQEAYRTGRPAGGPGWQVEVRGSDGRVVPTDYTAVPVRDEVGRITGSIGIGQDARPQPPDGSAGEVPTTSAVTELQDALLPQGVPVVQGAEIGARYVLADDGGSGGDWFDAFTLPGGRVVLVVGDVVGRGVEAAVTMGELRVLFEERVREDGDVLAAVELLDRRAGRVPEARAASVCAAVFDPAGGELTYCTAGHPPPLVLSASGESTYLSGTSAGRLGSGHPVGSTTCTLATGDLLLLYTDGLVTRPGRTATENPVELLRVADEVFREAAAAGPASDERPVDRICRAAPELLTSSSGIADDIAVLALQAAPPVAPYDVRLPALAESVRTARAGLDEWLVALGVTAIDRLAVQQATGELVSNVVDHAYATVDPAHQVRVRVELIPDGRLELSVSDDGRWSPPAAGPPGRGLAMASAFLDTFHVEHGDAGTRARGCRRVHRPVTLLRSTSSAAARRPAIGRIDVAGSALHVRGPVDHRCVDDLRGALARASLGGARAVTVDLAEVDVLSSAAVQALYDARAAGRVELVAPWGSPAQHVLDLVGLPYASSN